MSWETAWPLLGGAVTAALLKGLDLLISRSLAKRAAEQAREEKDAARNDAAEVKREELQATEAADIRRELRQIERELRAQNTELLRQNAELNGKVTFQAAQIQLMEQREAARRVEREELQNQLRTEQTARLELERLLALANSRIADLEHQLAELRRPATPSSSPSAA